VASLVFVALLTVVFGGIPWGMAKKKTKNLDYLKEL
jgi:hypothetical protein